MPGGVLAGPRHQVSFSRILEEGHIQSGRVLENVAVDPEIQLVVQTAPQERLQLQAHCLGNCQAEGEKKPNMERAEAESGGFERQDRGVHQPTHGESLSGRQQSEHDYQHDEPHEQGRAGGPDQAEGPAGSGEKLLELVRVDATGKRTARPLASGLRIGLAAGGSLHL